MDELLQLSSYVLRFRSRLSLIFPPSNLNAQMWTHLNHFTKDARIFTPMPLYHSTAAILAIGVAWNVGATVIIGRKFSASTFWKEVRDHDANVIQ